jgi:hypothetical protein
MGPQRIEQKIAAELGGYPYSPGAAKSFSIGASIASWSKDRVWT